MSRAWIHSTRLESQCEKSGISRTAPPRLAPGPQSLPPILHRSNRNPISGYSKGSRGLSVFPRVSGVFTATSISPSPSSRQRPDRYKIRAGRNLPDKEFRYLRTVIVTADIHRGFGSELRPACAGLTPCLNLSALVTCQSLYIIFRFSRDLCF